MSISQRETIIRFKLSIFVDIFFKIENKNLVGIQSMNFIVLEEDFAVDKRRIEIDFGQLELKKIVLTILSIKSTRISNQ